MLRFVKLIDFLLFATVTIAAPDPTTLLAGVKKKYDLVNNYIAVAQLKTNVLFIKAPISTVNVYYKKPDQLKIKNQRGVSFIPKGFVNINLNNVLGLQNFEAVAAGTANVNGVLCQIVKIFPLSDEEDITRATLYIDEARLLVLRSVISTKETGTYEINMQYRNYANWGLPDRVIVEFNTRDFKLPKGTTLDYDNGVRKEAVQKGGQKGPQKGKVEILYSSYKINQGVSETLFQ
jgi:hypothetical protein